MSKIAVLIPSYKPGKYLDKCFRSLERQSLRKSEFRVYVALNGPKQPYERKVKALLSCYSFQSKCVYIESPGVSRARNSLLDLSIEPFVTFLDDDDFVSDKFLERLLDKADERFISVSNVLNFRESDNEPTSNYIGLSFNKLKQTETSKWKSRKFFSSSCAKLICRRIINDFKFDERLTKGEDSLFMAQLSCNVAGIKKCEDDAIYFVFDRSDSASRKKTNILYELSRVTYLLIAYLKLLWVGKYEKAFVFSRIIATLNHLRSWFFK
jgi:glycosyltransferase involved in cell wall biosynthesis